MTRATQRGLTLILGLLILVSVSVFRGDFSPGKTAESQSKIQPAEPEMITIGTGGGQAAGFVVRRGGFRQR